MLALHGISDPGEEIVKSAIQKDIEIIPIPGACAFVNALIASGLDTKEFSFYGFLPLNKKNRKQKLNDILNEQKTIILYEAPHKLIATLKDLQTALGDRDCVIAKELTKIHEKFIRGRISELLETLTEPKGEYIVLIKGQKKDNENELNALTLEDHYKYYENQGMEKKEIIKKIAKDLNVPKNEIYQKFI